MNDNFANPRRVKLLTFFQQTTNGQFIIPVYQRNYTWKANKQVKKYLMDLEALVNSDKKSHFLGVMMYVSSARGTFSEYSIVDGQQRIVTTFLILQAIYSLAKESGDKATAEQIQYLYLTNPYQDVDKRLKLKPTVSDDNVYEKIINSKESEITADEKKTNIYKNYYFILDYIRKLVGKHNYSEILLALNNFYFVEIPLTEDDNSQEIFETINSAGAALSKSDLIRNFILMKVDNAKQEEYYEKYWAPLEDMLSNRIENFFRLFIASKTYTLSNLDDLYDNFQLWYNEEKNRDKSIEDLLKDIVNFGKYYRNLFIDYKHNSENLKKHVIEFNKNPIEPAAPLLLRLYELFEKKNMKNERLIKEDDFIKIIDLLITYSTRRNICNFRTGVLTRIIPPMIKDILNDCDGDYRNIYAITVKYLVLNNKNKASFMPDDNYLRANLPNSNAYGLKNYYNSIFQKIELHNNSAPIDFDKTKISIEHLMPQTPTQAWLDELNITEDKYESQLHRLGNLTLATQHDNSKMSNKPFEYKKQVLEKTSHLKINQDILNKDTWTIKDIDERTDKLIEQIIDLYTYPKEDPVNIMSYHIYYQGELNDIEATIYTDLHVEIKSQSKVSLENCQFSEQELQSLCDEGIIKILQDTIEFLEDLEFTSLQNASYVLLNLEDGSIWEEWKDSKGDSLSLELRAKLLNKRNS